jgi:hypothetical protein
VKIFNSKSINLQLKKHAKAQKTLKTRNKQERLR